MLLSHGGIFGKNDRKWNKRSNYWRDLARLSSLPLKNKKYLNLPQNIHQPRNTVGVSVDRTKVYQKRSENPIVIPHDLVQIPQQLAVRYDDLDESKC